MSANWRIDCKNQLDFVEKMNQYNITICLPMDRVQSLEKNERVIITSCYVSLCLLSTSLNSLVLYVILKTRQWKNQSVRLIFFVSCADILWAWLGNVTHAIYVLVCQLLTCQIRVIILAITNMATYTSLDFIVVVGLDRFLHIYYLNDYAIKFSPARFKKVMIAFMVIMLLQSLAGQ